MAKQRGKMKLDDLRPARGGRAPAAAVEGGNGERVKQSIRLSPEAWRQLKTMAMDRRVSMHQMILEAINGLFREHGKPPIA